MSRSTLYLTLTSILLSIGSFAFADEKGKTPGPPQPPTIEEQIQNLQRQIRRNEKRAMSTDDPEMRVNYEKMARNLEIVRSFKLKQAKGASLTKEERQQMKEAQANVARRRRANIAKREAKEKQNPQPAAQKKASQRRRPPSDSTYETQSGFKVRLRMPE